MARPRKGELTASMAILGLVVRQPDTRAGLGIRLADSFPAADWSRSIVYSAMEELRRRDSVRVVERGAERSLDRYEATPEGVEEFLAWLRATSAAVPVLRDVLLVKLALCEEEDLPSLIQAVRGQEEACMRATEDAMSSKNRARRAGRFGPAKGADSRSRRLSAMMTYEMMLWSDMAKRLQRFRLVLENPKEEEAGAYRDGDEDG